MLGSIIALILPIGTSKPVSELRSVFQCRVFVSHHCRRLPYEWQSRCVAQCPLDPPQCSPFPYADSGCLPQIAIHPIRLCLPLVDCIGGILVPTILRQVRQYSPSNRKLLCPYHGQHVLRYNLGHRDGFRYHSILSHFWQIAAVYSCGVMVWEDPVVFQRQWNTPTFEDADAVRTAVLPVSCRRIPQSLPKEYQH